MLFVAGCTCDPPINPYADGWRGGGSAGGGDGQGGGGGVVGGGSGGGAADDAGVIVDPLDPHNAFKDSDCDGLSDQTSSATSTRWQAHRSGQPDSDGDGILDGVEAGRMTSVDPACNYRATPIPPPHEPHRGRQ